MLNTQLTKNAKELIGIGYSSIVNANDLTPQMTPGIEVLVIDEFGQRWFRYVKNITTSNQPCGTVMRRVADVAVSSFTSGSTTSITKAASLTANAHVGKIVTVEVGATAGAAPEGESGVIVSNDATTVNIDPAMPFSVAAATGNYRIWAPWHADISGANVVAENVLGVVINPTGIDTLCYGWLQLQGPCPKIITGTGAAIAAGAAIITGATGTAVTIGAGAADLVIGYALSAAGSTNVGFFMGMLTLQARGGVSI